MSDMQAIQTALEEESLGLSVKRYQAAVDRDLSQTGVGKALMKRVLTPFMRALEEYIRVVGVEGNPGKGASTVTMMMASSVSDMAYLTARECIRMACRGDGAKLTATALKIAGYVEDTLDYSKLATEHPKLFKSMEIKLAQTSSDTQKHLIVRGYTKRANDNGTVTTIKWGPSEKLRFGTTLIHILADSTEFISIEKVTLGLRNTPMIITATPETLEWLSQGHQRDSLLMPMYMPMVIPPKQWGPGVLGGFTHYRLRVPLVRRMRKAFLAELADRDMPAVYDALNALQETRWAINKSVLNVVEALWNTTTPLPCIPARDDIKPPAMEPGVAEDPEKLRDWKHKASDIARENIKLRSKRLSCMQTKALARRFSEYPALYMPHNLDFRGRMYPLPVYLNPQGDDLSKGLLTFADGVKLGEAGVYYLAVHGANSYGVDKLSFDERVQWVVDHDREILQAAMDPLSTTGFWTMADKGEGAWRFLAFCIEWLQLRMWEASGNARSDFESHLPVGWDGSCNGLQHYSAMLRDEVGGVATNLVPSDTPSDIYAQVAQQANLLISDAVSKGVPEALPFVGKVNRSLAKRPTMTYPYGAGRFGFREQLMDILDEMDRKDREENGPVKATRYIEGTKDNYVAANWLAGLMSRAIPGVVRKASEAMGWLQESARLVSSDALAVTWTSPSGLLVRQDYRELLGREIDVTILGSRCRIMLQIETEKCDKRRQAQGIAPNFVHACDAAHLAFTVQSCRANHGIRDFQMVHDSYGAHAGHAQTLRDVLRQEFVNLYTHNDVLETLRSEFETQIHDPKVAAKLPPVPEKGSLDLEGVLQSEYFFA